MLRRLGQTVLAASAATAVVAAASVAYGSIPSSDDTITACVDSKGGLKLIDAESGATCGPSKTEISWNQQGPAGQDGVSGYEIVTEQSATDSLYDKTVFAQCPTGKKAVGGGAGVYGPWLGNGQLIVHGVGLVQDHPFNDSGWVGRAEELVPTDDDWYVVVEVICADVS